MKVQWNSRSNWNCLVLPATKSRIAGVDRRHHAPKKLLHAVAQNPVVDGCFLVAAKEAIIPGEKFSCWWPSVCRIQTRCGTTWGGSCSTIIALTTLIFMYRYCAVSCGELSSHVNRTSSCIWGNSNSHVPDVLESVALGPINLLIFRSCAKFATKFFVCRTRSFFYCFSVRWSWPGSLKGSGKN